jgi:hypothetical protein
MRSPRLSVAHHKETKRQSRLAQRFESWRFKFIDKFLGLGCITKAKKMRNLRPHLRLVPRKKESINYPDKSSNPY